VGFLLAFGLCLLVAVAVSELARRTVLSTSVLFLAVGVVLGAGALGVLELEPEGDLAIGLVEVALVTVLFTDGTRLELAELSQGWQLPLRALVVGLPVTGALTAVAAWALEGLAWPQALLLGAVLSPTDPVLAEAIVGRSDVPGRLRRFLNVESGLNDGLALPFVVIFLAAASGDPAHPGHLAREIGVGIAVGLIVPYLAVRFVEWRFFGIAERYEPLGAIATALVVLSTASLLGGNLFLAAFIGGVVLAAMSPVAVQAFSRTGEVAAEIVKLGALLAFGLLFSSSLISDLDVSDVVFTILVLVAVRPLALLVAFAGRSIDWPLFAAAAWFGPKGFASVTFSLIVLQRNIVDGGEIFHLAGLVVATSIVAHSSTDVLVAHVLARRMAKSESQRPTTAPSRR
jgi:NhaP-type Na+/H+ or K+/H+ antiporter